MDNHESRIAKLVARAAVLYLSSYGCNQYTDPAVIQLYLNRFSAYINEQTYSTIKLIFVPEDRLIKIYYKDG